MHSKRENTSLVPEGQGDQPATICAQPWWRGSSLEMTEGGVGTKAGQSQPDDGRDEGADVSKEVQNLKAQSDGRFGHEHQQLQHATSNVPPVMAEYGVPHTQLELGHSIACASYPYSDHYYGRVMTAYGPQALVHPHVIGVHHTRMPLPLEMAEEPVYVNAKQYHGILRRRQSRAKAELEKKLIKVRKPYLHESRHQHAMRRARGNGGRFLNTKKLDNSATQRNTEDIGSGASAPLQSASSSGSDGMHSDRMLCSSNMTQEVKGPMMQDMREQHTYASGSGCYQQHSGFPMSAFHPLSGERGEEGKCLGQQRSGMLVGQAPHRAVTIQ
ncbi:hypothetical protein MRB53_005272 [Persea americana]|uniref:Uncharacterized protein n=1 Tax=Persea americana TaxID=3435 RepID=A0ACC2MCU7_PERAE|nr:hypothetical protein MRB53_005272 [Persea americana]|eukprot:TRINITY_DN2111_c0_g2_i4.p1 TRINITY_DN2111_c0_g2~~TRINITY_DN2111_c0_g2_i4.p1  ORF type:complete len:328 (+),score=63.21 TRINITY_DN2111_c0_g2_i4:293-1276(+)